ncbi:hypothetical protein I553_9360 [Mycobacterium xenopi 4042]|uniref:Uncharacterized protein n=1 Tax=Mycobacterium xenopi 4042 TaxID=1299334 RepID=X8DXT1_MYCXE|nr:hypothetical protein I553_9360 [Mycobacterium xenopi 4042]
MPPAAPAAASVAPRRHPPLLRRPHPRRVARARRNRRGPGFGPDSPPTQDFMYPSIGTGCLADGSNSIATALSVAGPPRSLRPPGPGQTAYVFTAIGTPGPPRCRSCR